MKAECQTAMLTYVRLVSLKSLSQAFTVSIVITFTVIDLRWGGIGMKETDKMIYRNEIDCLKYYATDKYVVEIGAFKGWSTTIIGGVATYLITIDTFKSSNLPCHQKGKSTLDEFVENTAYLNNNHVLIGDSHDEQVYSQVPCCIQFLFIDGDHTYEGCLADLNNFVPKVAYDGIVGLHDYGLMYPTVIAACANHFGRNPDEIHGTLAIYKMQSKSNKTTYYQVKQDE